MKLTVNIATDGTAFADDPEGAAAAALRRIASRIEHEGHTDGVILDDNGNTVGTFALELGETS